MAPHSSSPPSALSLADSPDLHEKELGEATTASPSTLPVLKKVAGLGVMLLVVFWLNAAWLLGSYYNTSNHAFGLTVLIADFDEGPVGSALLAAVASVNGRADYPNFVLLPSNSTSPSALQQEVFDGNAWAAMWATESASQRFRDAVSSDAAARSYDPTQAWVYTGLEVRYATVWSGVLLKALLAVEAIATAAFARQTVAPILVGLNSAAPLRPSEAQVLAAPVAATFINQAPFPIGERAVMNTVGFVLPVLFQFFFIMGMNAIAAQTKYYRGASLRKYWRVHIPVALVWTLLSGLSVISWSVTFFDSGFHISAGNFFALWAVGWACTLIFFDILDTIVTFVPAPFLPPIIIPIIILSVAAASYPIELLNPFYRIHYAFPAHAVWAVMMTIYGNGAVKTLRYNIPILVGWLIIGKTGVVISLRHRAKVGQREVFE